MTMGSFVRGMVVGAVAGMAADMLLRPKARPKTEAGKALQSVTDAVDNAANDTAYPENAPAWKNNSAVTVNGNYVVMGVLPEGVTLPAAFKAEF